MGVEPTAGGAAAARGTEVDMPEQIDHQEMLGLAIFIVIGVTLMVLSWLTRLYLRTTATTDPHELAKDDPWVRAYLARTRAARAAAPREPASPARAKPGVCDPAT
jgi:hypothetical protein